LKEMINMMYIDKEVYEVVILNGYGNQVRYTYPTEGAMKLILDIIRDNKVKVVRYGRIGEVR